MKIWFLFGRFYCFCNFSSHPLSFYSSLWTISEHLVSRYFGLQLIFEENIYFLQKSSVVAIRTCVILNKESKRIVTWKWCVSRASSAVYAIVSNVLTYFSSISLRSSILIAFHFSSCICQCESSMSSYS